MVNTKINPFDANSLDTYFNELASVSTTRFETLCNDVKSETTVISSVLTNEELCNTFDRANVLMSELLKKTRPLVSVFDNLLLPLKSEYYSAIEGFQSVYTQMELLLCFQIIAEKMLKESSYSQVFDFDIQLSFIKHIFDVLTPDHPVLDLFKKRLEEEGTLLQRLGQSAINKSDEKILELFNSKVAEKKKEILSRFCGMPQSSVLFEYASKRLLENFNSDYVSLFCKMSEDVVGFIRASIEARRSEDDLKKIYEYEAYRQIQAENMNKNDSIKKVKKYNNQGDQVKTIDELIFNKQLLPAVFAWLHEQLDKSSLSSVVHESLSMLLREGIIRKIIPYDLLTDEFDIPWYTENMHKHWKRNHSEQYFEKLDDLAEDFRTFSTEYLRSMANVE